MADLLHHLWQNLKRHPHASGNRQPHIEHVADTARRIDPFHEAHKCAKREKRQRARQNPYSAQHPLSGGQRYTVNQISRGKNTDHRK
ncbi:hypothetical protein D3C79_977260 [compost metagenome]